jgi:hypothetical protein
MKQGDSDDWEYEDSRMEKVYRNSYCNIAAADARDSTGGLFRQREPQDVISSYFEVLKGSPVFGKQRWRVVRDDLWEQGLLSKPLYERGWVYQGQYIPQTSILSAHDVQSVCLPPGSYTSADIRFSGTALR